jgi:hypothetical protein
VTDDDDASDTDNVVIVYEGTTVVTVPHDQDQEKGIGGHSPVSGAD